MGDQLPTIQSGRPLGPDTAPPRGAGDGGRLGDRAGLAANVVTIGVGVVSLVQAVRSNPAWILLGIITLTGLVGYWFRRRRWTFTLIGLAVLLTFVSGGWLLVRSDREPGPAPMPGPARAGPAATNQATTQATTPAAATIFSDVVQLDKETGVDLDGGAAVVLYHQDATADLYLAWGYILYTSARHSAMYDDSNAGSENGAYARCQTYRRADKPSTSDHYIGGGNQQYCFTTSDGHPGWLQAVNEVAGGGLLLKVDIWAA